MAEDPPDTAPAAPATLLEFALAPEAAARLPRLRAIAGARSARARTTPEALIWQDSAAGELAAAGLALETPRRGPPRLHRILPSPGEAWLPGTPAPELEHEPPATGPLMPVAAFDGRRTIFVLDLPEGPVQAALLTGKLRAVAAEEPVARLWLGGGAEAVLALAASLAGELHLLPPRAALAEEGRALARGEAPRARRRGPAELAPGAPVEAALEAAVGHLLEAMLHHAPACRPGLGPEGVHQTRVALRRLRSVLKAFRGAVKCPELANFDAGLKRLADTLGPARDWDVFLAGLGAEVLEAAGPDRRVMALLKAAELRREAGYAALGQMLDGPGFPRLVLEGQAMLLRRPWREGAAEDGRAALLDQPVEEFAAPLLARRWHALKREGEEIDQHGPEALHEVRLEAKRLRYAAELFAPLWSAKAARRFLRRLAALQEALGLANDTAVARGLVASLAGVPPWAAGLAEGFALARAIKARRRALDAWDGLMAADRFWP